MKRAPRSKTLAATLDRTKWDYSPATDRSFLLSSVERVFNSVAWEISSQHLAPISASVGTDSRNVGPKASEMDRFASLACDLSPLESD